MTTSARGLSRALLVDGDFVLLRMALVDDLDGDYEAAIVLQRIAWRCEHHEEWTATHAKIQAETRLSARKVKRALGVLRSRGYLTSRRTSPWDPTQAWRVVFDSAPVGDPGDARDVHHVMAESTSTGGGETVLTSLEDRETTPTPTAGVAPGVAPTCDGATNGHERTTSPMVTSPTKRPTPIPNDFTASPAMVAWARRHTPDVDAAFETQQFRDFHANSGKRGLDWVRAWHVWMRREQKWSDERRLRRRDGRPTGFVPISDADLSVFNEQLRAQWGETP